MPIGIPPPASGRPQTGKKGERPWPACERNEPDLSSRAESFPRPPLDSANEPELPVPEIKSVVAEPILRKKRRLAKKIQGIA
jgi:hypothetical protein